MIKCLMMRSNRADNWSPKRCQARPTEKVEMSKSKAKMLEKEPKKGNGESKK